MTTQAIPARSHTATSSYFARSAAFSAFLAAISGLGYALAFVVLRSDTLAPLFLLLGGLFSLAPLTAIYQRVRESEAGFALLGWFLALIGSSGALIHGAYDLANALHPSTSSLNAALANLPNPIDPRGLLTFGVTGVALFIFSWLMSRARQFPIGLSYLGYILGVLLVVLYLGRLILLDPKNPLILVDALLTGFLLNPLWYLWVGLALWRAKAA